jgi:hypothetical protein
MADKEKNSKSSYSAAVRITCIVLVALTVLGGTLAYLLSNFI